MPGGADTNLDESLFADVPAGGEFSDSIGQRVPDLFRIASETAPTPLFFPEPRSFRNWGPNLSVFVQR